jgi:hypothetical protein
MAAIEDIYAAAERAGFLKEVLFLPSAGSAVRAMVEYRAADASLLDGLATGRDYRLTYPASRLVGLTAGDTLTLEGRAYRVREVRAIGDGTEMRATLTRL